jgi:hypothetical protein
VEQVHILNGDSLNAQIHGLIEAELIVTRECLIDGNVQGHSLTEFYRNRASFIAEYDGFEANDYYLKTVPEIEKIIVLPAKSEVVCWFEDDLFCQTNFWFVVYLLASHTQVDNIRLVRPNKGNEYSFADMSGQELIEAFENRQQLTAEHIKLLAQLWPLYQQQNYRHMYIIAEKLNSTMPFLIPAIEAQERRAPDESGLGHPERQLLAIINDLNTTDFSTVFREFSVKEGIYSFGDLQVKRMFDQLIKHKIS